MTVGCDRFGYPEDLMSPATSILDIKIHLNSTISDEKKDEKYVRKDIK